MRGAVIVAAGSGTRYGQDKLLLPLLGKSVLEHSVDVMLATCDVVVVVGKKVDGCLYADGGATRALSVQKGLAALPQGCNLVAVHDGARPFISAQFVNFLFDEASKFGSAVPGLAITDTVWQQGENGLAKADRNRLFSVQTPQVFATDKLLQAMACQNDYATDESTLFCDCFGDVHFVQGERSNVKITYPGDLPTFSVGAGFDVHPFEEGDGVILGGVKIPYNKKLKGHSDADALCHAICDGVLGASGNEDIGHQFPDTDPQFKGANSMLLLAECVRLAHQCGWEVASVSAVVICQQPKIAPHLADMQASLAKVLGVSAGCVSISATTTEHLGALGNGDGIATQAQVLLRKF